MLAQEVGLAGRHPDIDAGCARDCRNAADVVDVAVGDEHPGRRPAAAGELRLDGVVEVTGVRRRGTRSQRPGDDWRFEAGDAVVLLGRPGSIATAEHRLLKG